MAHLQGYRFGRLTVDGHEHTRDLIVLPDRVVADWWRREGHSLAIEDLERCSMSFRRGLSWASARGIAKRARVSWLKRWSSRVLVEATDIPPVAERAGVALPA
jgi:hypothetical protein